ncbi:MAG: class I mannose-6-phosphate isomerase [Sphingomonadaceae bacterium]|nr:class I mannose-6-phosphate isomerase [Sphingomonadaceae bacterium]
MPATRLNTIRVEKPWGRETLWPGFDNSSGEKVGEIWFEAPEGSDPELMVKYLFTSERLSIQVHPDDAAARASGHKRGKDEAWVILDADPEATIALGLRRTATREELRAAALDGEIETLVDWRPVSANEFIYSLAGTVHAIGAGLTLIEVQQNVDLTYRLYDYGRPRELHLDEGIAVSDPAPFVAPPVPGDAGSGRTILCEGGKFVMERWSWSGARTATLPEGLPGWLIPIAGGGAIDGSRFTAGECWIANDAVKLEVDPGADLLFAYPLAERLALF